MTQDAELIELRARVDCRVILERAGWRLDKKGSTRRAAKYRRGAGEIIIVTHDGKGWFDPMADASRGDVIALAQKILGGNLGQARKALRPLAGIAPLLMPVSSHATALTREEVAATWAGRSPPKPGSAAWKYLTESRRLPPSVVMFATQCGLLREGVTGTAWFLHRLDGKPSGWEMRGPRYKGFVAGGLKTAFVLAVHDAPPRIVVCEGAIDALSLAALEGVAADTAYVSTAGGWGEKGTVVLDELLVTANQVVAATDQDQGGELLAARIEQLASRRGVPYTRLRPTAKDWNEAVLTKQSLTGDQRRWVSCD